MIPPVEDAVLQENPEFATLYNTLTTAILNPDGSSKNDPSSKERQATQQKLKTHRLKAAKQHLLVHALSTAAPPPPPSAPSRRTTSSSRPAAASDLPEPLLDLLLLLPPLLTPTPEVEALLADPTLLTSPPLSDLPSLLPQLGDLVSASLHQAALSLARHTNPTTNPSYLHRHLPTLGPGITASHAALATAKAELSSERLAAAAAVQRLLALEAQALGSLARTLEAKHGASARSLELRAAEVALSARQGEAEAKAALYRARRHVYTPEAGEALEAYAAHLRDSKVRVFEACRARRAELAEYGVAEEDGDEGEVEMGKKEKTMRDLAKTYRDMGRQINEVKRDLDRLDGA
ncbi:uncharacterized protein PpBr36_06127 [Pyricularia pennisetigena]|uniref:uncharacterized protein n=1 Tax=Pyricularia pennisetigena TaxID=1578925 RepID=UPI0011549DDA|nr:uncharacterized protein PpBr36_06127 [Pyricularia pennisetigena]TLS23035.1 hypothetical protein PpBr36_06127 [Pyricularia pennisetigena]